MSSIHIRKYHQLTGIEGKIKFVAIVASIRLDLLFLVSLLFHAHHVYIDPVFILLGIGVGLVFILLGFTVYFFLSCIQNDRILEPELAAENIYINAKSGNINSKTSSSPRPITASSPGLTAPPSPGVDLNYYPVSGQGQGRRRRQTGEAAGDRYDRHGRALAPSCIYPLLALVSTAAMCFISILVILCYLSNLVNP